MSDWISLVEINEKKIKDIEGYFTNDYGGNNFVLVKVIFEDDTSVFVGGEHDFPYLEVYESSNQPKLLHAIDKYIEGD